MQKYFNSRLLVISIALSIIGVIGQTVWVYKHMVDLADKYYQAARDSYVALYDLKRIEKEVIDMETGLRGFLLTGDPAILKPYNEARQEMRRYYEELYRILGQDTASLAHLDSINKEIQSWISTVAEPAIANRKLLGQDAVFYRKPVPCLNENSRAEAFTSGRYGATGRRWPSAPWCSLCWKTGAVRSWRRS